MERRVLDSCGSEYSQGVRYCEGGDGASEL